MPAATSKTELLKVFDTEWAKLDNLLTTITDEQSRWSEDGVSIKAVIGHRIHWLGLFWSWYDAGAAGERVETPAPGYKWNQLKAYNAPIYAAADKQDWAGLVAQFRAEAADFRARLDRLENTELYTAKRYDWTNDWTLGRWAESAAPSHFRSAAKLIRKIVRAGPPK